ncbi:MAG: chlorophyll synthesis pathway protein BchC [Roseiflexaceae bacterium]
MHQARAVVIPSAKHIELRTVELTPAATSDVVVETVYTSISAGTERMLYDGRMPHPMLQFPVIPGYETVGKVVNAPHDANELIGKWVYVGGARCYTDVNPAWGGQSSHLHVDHQRVVSLDGMNPEHGVLLALAATAYHGIDIAGEMAGQRVLVIGQGPVGQLAARIAMLRGAEVTVVDRVTERLQRAQAHHIINVAVQPLTAHQIPACDVIIEASGSMEALSGAISTLALNGRIVLLGYYDELHLPYMPLFLKQAQLMTAKEWAQGDLQRCRDLIVRGDLDVSALITHRQPIDNVVAAYHTALFDQDCLKVLLNWSQSA